MESYFVKMTTLESTPTPTSPVTVNLNGFADKIIGISSNDPLDGFYGKFLH